MQTETEVDFVHLAKTIWKRKLLVVKLTGIAAVAGFLISIMIPDRYTASTTLVQQIADPRTRLNEEKLAAISALAAVAGVDLNGVTNARMTSKTFSTIMSSVPFRQELMKTKLNFGQTETATTLYDYYAKQEKDQSLVSSFIGIPGRILNALKKEDRNQNRRTISSDFPQLTREELKVNRFLDKQVTLQLHDDEYITISCTLPEAYAAAQLTRSAQELLERYLTDMQTEKARANLKFIQQEYDSAKTNFLRIHEELSSMHTGKENANLSASCRLAENVYSDLTRKLEQSKIALNEQTPVFRTINPVAVPLDHSFPNRTKTTLIFSFFGLIMAIIVIFGREFFEETKEKWVR